MTDHNTSSLSRPDAPTRPPFRSSGSSIPRSSSSYGHYDIAESSTAGSLSFDRSMNSVTFGRSSSHSPRPPNSDARFTEQREQSPSHDAHRRRRSHKPRPSGGFLLTNSILDENPKSDPKHRSDGRRRSRIPVDSRKGKSPLRSSGESSSSVPSDSYAIPDSQDGAVALRTSAGGADIRDDRPRSQIDNRRRSMIPSFRPSSAPLDVDSTQIVSMALDLSESRRLASRRNISSPIPPRLAQLPDTTPGRSLKQHLQQQRRTSRNISPRADQHLSSRVVSVPRSSSPLQPTLDHDGSYTYHFSSSTLNRAQKAKEYVELMVQYRRLLLFIPPLKQGAHSRPSSSNPTASPGTPGTSLEHISSQSRTLGRAYNPLQYIRNRKIRTRERKTIDGEAQGFADVPRVADWVDYVAAYTASSQLTESTKLPPFVAADECMAQQLPASNLPRPVTTLNKPKRPRIDWSIDPADMLADIYWLEQDDNKYLIEDRHYAKIFTPMPKPVVPQPATQVIDHSKPTAIASTIKESTGGDDRDTSKHNIEHSAKPDGETALTSTGDRARRKLRDLRGMHHKHTNSGYSHLKFRRGSSPDSSDDESDHRRRRGRTGTISASGKDLLEKQMIEMLAKEDQEEQNRLAEEADTSPLKPLPAGMVTPDHTPQVSRRGSVRGDPRIEAPGHLDKGPRDKPIQSPPIHSGRESLEVPNNPYRSSMELDSPRPVLSTPKGHQHGHVANIGATLSPSASRPGSPARNPFSKVKSIFRDRSRDREGREHDDGAMSPIDPVGTLNIPVTSDDTLQPLRRPRSRSSGRDFVMRSTHETHKSHRSMGSLSLRPDEQIGLKAIFKGGAKLDGMIRGGVSKMTDLIWKKDSDSSDSSEVDSDVDVRRGRSTMTTLLSPGGSVRHHEGRHPTKSYMDIMPNFRSTADSLEKPASHEADGSFLPVLSRAPSRSPRFDQLKPPRIDIRKASPDASDLEGNNQNPAESDTPDTDSQSWNPDRTISRPRQTSMDLHNALLISGNEPSAWKAENRIHTSEHRNWILPNRTSSPQHAPISRREVARLRALILCSGIKAMEISRRINEPHPLFGSDKKGTGLPWKEVQQFASAEDRNLRVPQTELFPATARILSQSIDRSLTVFEKSASEFSTETAPRLQQRAEELHRCVSMELLDMTGHAADEADAVSHDIVDNQRLKVKSVADAMDKMLRRRRRRFRWVRRAGWLGVEWVLVGFMWYVWFIVMITRVILSMGRGVVSVVRWLLWL